DWSSDLCSSDLLAHQVHNQLHLVQAFKVSHLRRISGFDEGFKSSLDQRGQPAAEHGLFAEQIGFGLFTKSRFNYACPAAANGACVGQCNLPRVPLRVLMRSEEHTSELQS